MKHKVYKLNGQEIHCFLVMNWYGYVSIRSICNVLQIEFDQVTDLIARIHSERDQIEVLRLHPDQQFACLKLPEGIDTFFELMEKPMRDSISNDLIEDLKHIVLIKFHLRNPIINKTQGPSQKEYPENDSFTVID